MPIYEYRATNEKESCDHCRAGFEDYQKTSHPPLEICPRCGNEVEKIISTFSFKGGMTEKEKLSDGNLKKHGFQKIVNEGGGKFRRVV